MNPRPITSIPGRAIRATAGLSFIAVVLSAQTVQAQARIKPKGTVMVPRVIQGQAVESEVINGVVLIFGELPIPDAQLPGDPPNGQPARPKKRVIVFSGSLDELVYGSGSSATDARCRLEQRFRQTLEQIDRICELTEAQKLKLELAGRGDIKRFFDRAERLRAECNRSEEIADLEEFRTWSAELKGETMSLWRSASVGPLEARSLVAKCMKSSLTAEQLAKYARFEATPPYQPPDRKSLRFGGAIELGPPDLRR
jgi:hypothetical protein